MLYDLEKKEKKYQYEPKFDDNFLFVLSNGDEDNFILKENNFSIYLIIRAFCFVNLNSMKMPKS